MAKLLHIARVFGVSAILLASAALLWLSMPGSGWKALSVQTGSMTPAIKRGDLVLARSVPTSNIKIGDVITYVNPRNHKQTITHRVVQVINSPGNVLRRFVTKGDANPGPDPIVYPHQLVGVTQKTVPKAGFVFNWLKTWTGIIIVIYIPSLIIVSFEIRKLMQYYKSLEPYLKPGFDPTRLYNDPKSNRTRRATATSLVVVVAVAMISVPVAQALIMSSSAALTNNSISSITAANTLLIYQVGFTGGTMGACLPVNASATIANTGAGSVNTVTVNSTCHITTATTNNITVTNNNSQSATSGNASSTGGNATSGNASNSSSTSVSININKSSNSSTNTTSSISSNQSVTLYNPTSAAINLAGYKLVDNGAAHTIASGLVAANSYFVFTWPVDNGLSPTGDHIALRNAANVGIDSLSWGSDTTQLNPPVATTGNTATITRKAPALDTNTASDWVVQ